MAEAADVRVTQGATLVALRLAAERAVVEQAGALIAYNVPADSLRATAASLVMSIQRETNVRATQANILAAVIGRTYDPVVRAWTFSLDGHDFYVLRLGMRETLVYDTYSKQWVEWDSGDLPFWRPSTGATWVGAQNLGVNYGSNIVAGDDLFGVLWLLDPLLPYDDNPNENRQQTQLPFERVVTGQIVAKGRQPIPCYAVFLSGDNYDITAGFTSQVELEVSDDQGRTFVSCGAVTSPVDYALQLPAQWLSLGQITAPGRIFRITDNGVLTRIDTLEVNDGDDA